MNPVAKLLILVGLLLVGIGLVIHLLPGIPLLGRLPGDIRIERPGFRIYIPLVTCLMLSILISALLWLFSRIR